MKKTIILNGLDVVSNRKMISLRLDVWKKLISCSRYEKLTTTKLINKLIDRYIQENDYDIEKIFNDNLEVKFNTMQTLKDFDFKDTLQIEK
jgi:hypothetical protein